MAAPLAQAISVARAGRGHLTTALLASTLVFASCQGQFRSAQLDGPAGPADAGPATDVDAGADAGGSTDAGPVNLAPFPDGWVTDTPWGIPVPDADYGVYHDTDTTHDGAYTFRVDPGAALAVGAFDYASIAVAPGDRLFIKCWVKTAGASDGVFGARVWSDYYGAPSWGTGRIGGPDPFYSSGNVNGSGFVNWGTDWTQLIVDLIVPATVTADGQFDYSSGEPVVPTHVILWNQIWSDNYPASAYTGWFSDYEVYVNP
jgi:hypothetical protein